MRTLLLVLLGICCLTVYSVDGVGSEALERSVCMSLTTKPLSVNRIRTYTIKEGSMRAVIFITKRGIKICADPQHDWVKKAMKHVDNRKNTTQTRPTGTQQTTNTAVTQTS